MGLTRLMGSLASIGLLMTSALYLVHASTVREQSADSEAVCLAGPGGISLEACRRNGISAFALQQDLYTCANATGAKVLPTELLAGRGWDPLTETAVGAVSNVSYKLCQTTPDGLYIIPDTMQASTVKYSDVKQYSELYEFYSDYQSSTTTAMKLDDGYPKIGGSFSTDYYLNKKYQIQFQSVTVRTEIRREFYQIKVKPDATLSTELKYRLQIVGDMIHSNRTEAAKYEILLIIRDFGTHMLGEVTAGGIFQQEDQVTTEYAKRFAKTTANARAFSAAKFLNKLGFNFPYSFTGKQQEAFLDSVTQSTIRTFGGKSYVPGMRVPDWEANLNSSLVAVARRAEPLEYVITPHTVPELPAPTVRQISDLLAAASKEYFAINTNAGCTDINSANFNFQANVGDQSVCKPVAHDFGLGGVYQTCTSRDPAACGGITQRNPATGEFSCPDPYEPVLLHKGEEPRNTHTYTCYTYTGFCFLHGWLPFICAIRECKYVYNPPSFVYETYWCAKPQTGSTQPGYLFGGMYSKQFANPVTGYRSCPQHFSAVSMGIDTKLCMNDRTGGYKHLSSRQFGGFYSCSAGNPFALAQTMTPMPQRISEVGFEALTGPESWPHSCPFGYTLHRAAIDFGCQIIYCTIDLPKREFTRPDPVRPPYDKTAPLPSNHTIDVTNITGPGGDVWLKNLTTGVWNKRIVVSQTSDQAQYSLDSVSSSSSISSSSDTLAYTLAPVGAVLALMVIALVASHGKIRRLEAERPTWSHSPDVSFAAGSSSESDLVVDQDSAESSTASTTAPCQAKSSGSEAVNY